MQLVDFIFFDCPARFGKYDFQEHAYLAEKILYDSKKKIFLLLFQILEYFSIFLKYYMHSYLQALRQSDETQ
ncbi:hypothetical protein SJA_C1-30370 [Sphingobium indicum UT26S]|uniref:Uncharacterized protein n=1 Tax=Sphingobium indicum (strain DSM 16413 / CCM 7287 / MTCC 6362 / UT26 / NBRC 101211 / UT26S) TaxID=452662 RepID=D4Z5I9_SPHIU|nr:hypothetical protein SJA_C1-30370 [Sphingobium indicum UT26S]